MTMYLVSTMQSHQARILTRRNVRNLSRPVRAHTHRHYRDAIFARLPILSIVHRPFLALAWSHSHRRHGSDNRCLGPPFYMDNSFWRACKNNDRSRTPIRIKERIEKIRPHPITRHGEKKTFVFRELETSPYVFVRHDASGGPLQPPYDGPYQVIQRGTNTITVKINNKNIIVSIDRLKPAFIVSDDIEQQQLETSAGTHDTLIPLKTTTTQNAKRASRKIKKG